MIRIFLFLLLFPFYVDATTITPKQYIDMQFETIDYINPRTNKYLSKQFNFVGSSLMISSVFIKSSNLKVASLATGGISYGLSYLISKSKTSPHTKLYQKYKDGNISAVDILRLQKNTIKSQRKIVGGSLFLLAIAPMPCNRTKNNFEECRDFKIMTKTLALSVGTFIFFQETPLEQLLDKIIQNDSSKKLSISVEPSPLKSNLVLRYKI